MEGEKEKILVHCGPRDRRERGELAIEEMFTWMQLQCNGVPDVWRALRCRRTASHQTSSYLTDVIRRMK